MTTAEEIEDAVDRVWDEVAFGERLPKLKRLALVDGFWSLRLDREAAQGVACSKAPERPESNFFDENERLLTIGETATFLDVTPHTLNNWRTRGIGPRWHRVPGRTRVRYKLGDLVAWRGE